MTWIVTDITGVMLKTPLQIYVLRKMLSHQYFFFCLSVGHLPAPIAGRPMSYWNVSPSEAIASQYGDHNPHSQHSESILPVLTAQ